MTDCEETRPSPADQDNEERGNDGNLDPEAKAVGRRPVS